jgi:hypothetical protein|tara:strand:+ start:73 stop:582 length:510 start_codon:yes stop_codon:yes gene_type:complete
MDEIREIEVPEINVVVDLPHVAIPKAPPVTLQIGVPVIDMPHFESMDFEREVAPPPLAAPKPQPAAPPAASLPVPKIELPTQPKPVEVTEEAKPMTQQIIEALPTIPQATTVTVSSVIGVSAGLATPFLLKLIRPIVKKAAKKLQKALGRQPVPEGVSARRALQRSLRG